MATLFGDTAGTLSGNQQGGDQTLVGAPFAGDTLHGDALAMSGAAKGGADVVVGGSSDSPFVFGAGSVLYGDALSMSGSARGGNDRLVSGAVNIDDMFGDARFMEAGNVGGTDTFVFAHHFAIPSEADDKVFDFSQSQHDRLEFHVNGVRSIEDLQIVMDGDDTFIRTIQGGVTLVGFHGTLTAKDFVFGGPDTSTSYVLFGRTAAAPFKRDDWTGSDGANSHPGPTPGNGARASAFNADSAMTAGTVLAGSAASDYLDDGILRTSAVALFDLTESSPGAFLYGAAADLDAGIAAGNQLFGPANTNLDPAKSDVDVAAGTLHVALTDRDWNGIKNLEIDLESSSFRDVRLENFVDVRLKVGDDPLLLVSHDTSLDPIAVEIQGAKRGEIDASLASERLALDLAVWTNSSIAQNSFDIKGSIHQDLVDVFGGVVTGSPFGNKVGKPGYDAEGRYDGRFTTVFANLGAGSDSFHAGEFRAVDKVWGGTGDDFIESGAGNDRLFGDNGSGTDLNADPADAVPLVDDDFITEPIIGSSVPDFDNGLGPVNLGAVVDMGAYTISATGGDLVQLRSGAPGTFAGGLGIRSADDTIDSLDDVQVDMRGAGEEPFGIAEEITIDFKDGAYSVQLDFTGLFTEHILVAGAFPGDSLEHVLLNVFLIDGTSFVGAANPPFGVNIEPGAASFSVDTAETGDVLIDKITLQPLLESGDNAHADFFLSRIEARVATRGTSGDDILDAGAGADWLEGNSDRGSIEVLVSGELRRSGGDQLSTGFGPQGIGFDSQQDTVNFNDGDGVDTVAGFDLARDRLRMQGSEPITRTAIVDELAGLGTLMRHGNDGDAVFLIGVVDPSAVQIITF